MGISEKTLVQVPEFDKVTIRLVGVTPIIVHSHKRLYERLGISVPDSMRTERSIQQVLDDSGSTQEKEG